MRQKGNYPAVSMLGAAAKSPESNYLSYKALTFPKSFAHPGGGKPGSKWAFSHQIVRMPTSAESASVVLTRVSTSAVVPMIRSAGQQKGRAFARPQFCILTSYFCLR